jgi:hypothetical protein
VVPLQFEDYENKWKARMLFREYKKYVEDNGLKTQEMKDAESHLKKLIFISYLGFPV